MIYSAIIGGALILASGYWLVEDNYYKTGSSFTPDMWLLMSFIVTALCFGYLLSKFSSRKLRTAELLLFIALFGLSNLCQWDKNHSSWGISSEGSNPSPGLLGTYEPLVFDFVDRTPRLSDRIASVFSKQEHPTLWGQYKALHDGNRMQNN